MAQDFELGPAPVDPLDMSTLGGMPAAPQTQAPGMPPAPKNPSDKKSWLKLAMLLPLAAKQPGALEGLLMGWQQAQANKQATNRQGMLDQQAQQREQRIADQEQQRLMLAAEQQRAAAEARKADIATKYATGLQTLEDDDAIRAYIDFWAPQAQAAGISRAQLESTAMQTVKPSTLQKRAAEKVVGKLKAQFDSRWMEEGAKMTFAMPDSPVDPETGQKIGIPFQELLRRTGMTPDPNAQHAPAKTFEANTPEKMRIAALARELGKAPEDLTLQEINRATANQPDPILSEIRTLTAANLRAQQNALASGALSPAQFSQAQALAGDYIAETKDFWTQRSAYSRVLSANPSQDSPAGHMALIFAYMKLLDPNSVVRETEYANAQNASAVPDRIRNIYNRVVDGALLTPRQIADFKEQARQIYIGAKSGAQQVKAVYDQRAAAQGLPSSAVTYMLDDPAGAAPPQDTTTATPATQRIGRFEVEVEP